MNQGIRRFHLINLALLAAVLAACGTQERPEYVGQFAGDGAVVFLDQIDDELFYLNLELEGRTYGVGADYAEGSLSGHLDDFGQHPFSIKAQPEGTGIELSTSGRTFRMLRADGAPGPEQGGQTANSEPSTGSAGSSTATPDAARDQRLAGSYSRQEMTTTPAGSIATQMFLEIRPDGLFSEAMGDTLGGGMDWSGQAGGGSVETAEWTTQSGIFLVRPLGTQQWVPLARYTIQPGRLMFFYNDGSQQLWYRR